MRWWIGVLAALSASAARAEGESEPFAQVAGWAIGVESGHQHCKMYRFFGSSQGKGTEGLVVRYDAARENVMLTWTTENMTYLPADGDLELQLGFVRGKTFDDSWGGRTFHYQKPADTYYFSHRFTGPKESQRFLDDLAGNEIIGLDLGPVMLTALFLDAADATGSLRECALKVAGRQPHQP